MRKIRSTLVAGCVLGVCLTSYSSEMKTMLSTEIPLSEQKGKGKSILAAPISDTVTTLTNTMERSTKEFKTERKEDVSEALSVKELQSTFLEGGVTYTIYFPLDYDKEKERRYPVVYWLHGAGGSPTGANKFVDLIEPSIRDKKTPPMIVVGVDGMKNSMYCDSADGSKPVESIIIKELIPHIDATYRTISTCRGRAIEGTSMGAFGAMHLGFKYPEIFGSVTAVSGGVRDKERQMKAGNLVDVIFNGDREKFEANAPDVLLVKNIDRIRGKMFLRLVVGDKDGFLKWNQEFHTTLNDLEVEHELIVLPDVKHGAGKVYPNIRKETAEYYKMVFGEFASPVIVPSDVRE